MSEKKCRFCGGEIERISNGLICQNCGKRVELLDDTISESKSFEVAEEKHKYGRTKTSMIVLSIVVVLIVLCFVLFSGSPIEKILSEAYGIDDLEVVETYEFEKEVKDLGSGYTLALLKANGNYGIGLVNVDEGTTKDLAFQYTPLNIVVYKIFESDEITNIKHFNQVASQIELCGLDYFTNKSSAHNYLKKITGKNGVISTNVAQQAIIDNISLILPDISKSQEFEVIFDGNSAAPKYYAAQSSTLVYNWPSPPESVYPTWKAFNDTQTQNVMISIYGPPYVEKTVWAVVDKNFEEVGTYSSKETMLSSLR